MRKWHRSLAIVFGILLIWIAATGVAMQALELFADDDHDSPPAATAAREGRPPGAAPAPAATGGPVAPAARPKRTPMQELHHTLQHLHSGEAIGPVGLWLSFLAGLALLFFAASGLYMYIQMYRGRLVRVEQGKTVRGGRFFW
ncbi:PepSY domain-containing protein [Sphingomonas sp. ASV193]|uniref:PepSY domain-containing protein n=1 Tax=Sphingomonas sp. ASV193 TaxID=3144405 RepID=UPI0032E8BB2B